MTSKYLPDYGRTVAKRHYFELHAKGYRFIDNVTLEAVEREKLLREQIGLEVVVHLKAFTQKGEIVPNLVAILARKKEK